MTDTTQQFETVIGLEVHCQLFTKTKIFCGCANEFGAKPNMHTCPVCLGLPGSLPVFNKTALNYAMKIGLALDCQINPLIKFDRKNYYYPDLPKGYQITQFDLPVASNGFIMIPQPDGSQKKIGINRAHIEEDAGKLIHDNEANCSLVDYNRTGTPLMEIVTEPDMRSAQEAYDYLTNLKLTLQYLDVSDCDMEKGSLRCDANISIRKFGETTLGTKTELKNMNSFKAVKTALEYEINRHRCVILSGEKIVQQTLLWDEKKLAAIPMRSKEQAHDYRYFPEPDLVPFIVKDDIIEEIKNNLPERPQTKMDRLITEYKISDYDARILISDKHLAAFFENCASHYKDVKKLCNWMNIEVLKELNERKVTITDISLTPKDLAALLEKIDQNTISNLAAKDVLRFCIETGKTPEAIINEKGLAQVSDEGSLNTLIDEIIKNNPNVVQEVRDGKQSAIGFLIGQAMKQSKGKANPKMLKDMFTKNLFNN
ncbi:Asp-tRNA(Asn)/Glu-tRNA(Gln) amidotransferase subunit GatB [Candidatus Omnitrophota bacterium]